MSTPKIEVLVVRQPDGGTVVQLWLDGEPSDAWSVEEVDPGLGHMRTYWDEQTREVSELGYSEQFREAVVTARNDWAGSQFITDDREEE
jgi:hypothetical protein